MNRNIEFRGISIESNEFVYGQIVKLVLGGNMHYYIKEIDTPKVKVIPKTIGQSLEYKDINRIGIYEGDKINYLGAIGVVCYDESNSMYVAKFGLPMRSTWSFDSMDEEIKVIGNIHQDKEADTCDCDVKTEKSKDIFVCPECLPN